MIESNKCLTELVIEGTSDVIAQIDSPLTFDIGDVISVPKDYDWQSKGEETGSVDWLVVTRRFILMPGNLSPLGVICEVQKCFHGPRRI